MSTESLRTQDLDAESPDAESPVDWRDQTEPALHEIRRILERTGVTQRHLEERLGFSRGYLSQLLSRNLDLKLWHVLAILDGLGEAPGSFFARVYPGYHRSPLDRLEEDMTPLSEEIDATLARLYGRAKVDSPRQFRDRLAVCEEKILRLEANIRKRQGHGE